MSLASALVPIVRAHENQPGVRVEQMASLRNYRTRIAVVGAACLSLLFEPRPLWACAACYGQSDSSMAAGMNWGIMCLLGVIVFVLGGVAGFFVFLARRSVKLAAAAANGGQLLSAATTGQATAFGDHPNHSDSEPLTVRGNFGHVSTLARRRAKCAGTAQRKRY
jgi:hypothetical protein